MRLSPIPLWIFLSSMPADVAAQPASRPASQPASQPVSQPAWGFPDFEKRRDGIMLPPLHWDPAWPEFRTSEWVASGVLGVTTAAFTIIGTVGKTTWRGGIAADEDVRSFFRARSLEDRFRARDISDALLSAAVSYPFVDALLTAGWLRRSPAVAREMALINMEVYAATLSLVAVSKSFGNRERPYGRNCGSDRPEAARDCASQDRYASFFSGHAALSFAAASVNCSHHIHLGLYDSALGDALACGAGFLTATATGAMRMVGDVHYLSDVLMGAAVGTVMGFGLPWLLHYRHGDGLGKKDAKKSVTVQLIPMGAGVGLVGQF